MCLTLLLVAMGLTSWIGIRELRRTNNAMVIALYQGCMFYSICLAREFSMLSKKSVQLNSTIRAVISASNVAVLAAGPVRAVVIWPISTISNKTSSRNSLICLIRSSRLQPEICFLSSLTSRFRCHSFQRTMHSLISTRILLHLRSNAEGRVLEYNSPSPRQPQNPGSTDIVFSRKFASVRRGEL